MAPPAGGPDIPPPELDETAAPPPATEPTQHEIRRYAYFLYQQRRHSGIPGDAETDWHQAERLLRRDSTVMQPAVQRARATGKSLGAAGGADIPPVG